jgi:hypothetical protein
MSLFISEHHVLKFADDVMAAFQQGASRLRECVTVKGGVNGYSASFNRIQQIDAATKSARQEQHSQQNADHYVRWADLVYRYNALALDPDDEDNILANPKNVYVTSIAGALGRATDNDIQTAALGSARSGQDRTGSVALPAAQKVAAGGTGLTVAKLRSGKQILDTAEVPDTDRYLAINADGLNDLLGQTEVTSSDYASVKALVQGDVNAFLGFNVVRTEKVPALKAIMWHKSAIGLAISRDQNIRIAMRHDMHDAWEAYGAMHFGAVRIEDTGVVEISFV